MFETPLAKSAVVIPFETYRRAVLANGHLARDAGDIAVIKKVAPSVGATHVVVVLGSTETEGTKARPVEARIVEVSLVSAAGEVLYVTKRPLSGTRLTRSAASPIVAAISGKLASLQPEATPAAAAVSVPVPAPVPATLPVEPVPPPPAVASPSAGTPPASASSSRSVAAQPSAPSSSPSAVIPPSAALSPPSVAIADPPTYDGDHRLVAPTVVGQAPAPHPPALVSPQPTFDGRLGVLMLARDGRLRGSGSRVVYDGPLIAASASFAYFPWARRDAESALRGVGFLAEGYLGRVASDFRAGGSTSHDTVAGVEASVAYRFALGETPRAPAISLLGGYAYATFPMDGLPFPSLSYSSAQFGFNLDIPIVAHLAAFAGGRFQPWMRTGTDALGEASAMMGMRADLGLRLVIHAFELVAAGRFQQYNGSFSGVTDLTLASQLEDVRLVDRYYGGVLSVGYVF